MQRELLELNKREQLLELARKAKKLAYNPYSKFYVGAAIMTKDGKIYTGCNVENISYGLTVCAERVAIFKAISEGHKEFESIAISTSADTPTFPCGACRQVLIEFGDIEVYLDNDDGTYKLSEILPHSFNKNQM